MEMVMDEEVTILRGDPRFNTYRQVIQIFNKNWQIFFFANF